MASITCSVKISSFSHLPIKDRPAVLSSKLTSDVYLNWPKKLALNCIAGVLSFGLLSNPSFGMTQQSVSTFVNNPERIGVEERCVEREEVPEPSTASVSNAGIVDEAWTIVNESFMNYGGTEWNPEKWMKKREEIESGFISSRSRAHDIIKRLLASLHDPYTRFLTPSEFSKMAKYDMTGIGITLREVGEDDGATKLKILGLILGGPAHTAGVRQGDELLSVNSERVIGKSAFEASSLLQGPKETFVTIEVKHGNCGPTEQLKIQRQVIARTPVFYRLEPSEDGKQVGYIHLKEFNALARKDLMIAMKNLLGSGASYFVLDLRDNLGGLVQAGVEVAKLFLDQGEIVTYTAGRDPQVQRSIVAESAPLITQPIMVLINDRTASASEIVATALHDNCKAVLVGQRTFGKGLIQSVFELHDESGVVVTVGKYITPKHLDINGNGVEPDFLQKPDWREAIEHLRSCRSRMNG